MIDRFRAGCAVALTAAVGFATVTPLTRVAFEDGANVATVIVLRFLLSALPIALIVVLVRAPWRAPLNRRGVVAATAWFLVTMGHLSAIQFIPVSLAALLFYTFPLMTLGAKHVMARERLKRREVAAFVLAFVGLAVVLGPTFDELDFRGVALALAGAAAAVVFLITNERLTEEFHPVTMAFWLTVGCLILSALAVWVGPGYVAPTTETGWTAVAVLAGFTVIAFTLSLVAVRMAGATTTALFLNFEPIVIMGIAALLVGEAITANKLVGALLVVGALCLASLPSSVHQPDPVR